MITRDQIIQTLKSHKQQLLKHGISQVGLFGSYLKGEQTPGSDIDLLIDFEPGKENFDNYMAAYDLIEDIFRDYNVEVVTRNGLSAHIGPKILQDVMYV